MLIKHSLLKNHLKKSISGLYIIIGSDTYLMNETISSIKKAWDLEQAYEEKRLDITQSADWNQLISEANNYSLLSDQVLVDATYDKKTIEPLAKSILTGYANNINTRCLVIIRAPQLTPKVVQWIVTQENVSVIQLVPLDTPAFRLWIEQRLKSYQINATSDAVKLIQEKTQGNMIAAYQLIEKLTLVLASDEQLTIETVTPHLMDESEHQLYELTETWLSGQLGQTIYLLRSARTKKTEPVLILWLFSQAIRQLINLHCAIQQGQSAQDALSGHIRWPQQRKQYEIALKRLNLSILYKLLKKCHHIDERIKTGGGNMPWLALEELILATS